MNRQPLPQHSWLALLFCFFFCLFSPLTWAEAGLAQTTVCGNASYSQQPPKETVIFPLAQVKRGMCGVAYTVFEGVNPEPMQVEILGRLPNARGPGQDMILGRLHGTKPEYTGVVAGMSGSPVYIDGKLAGALSFRIGQFSKEPICGITPIEDMLQVRDGDLTPAGPNAGTGSGDSQKSASSQMTAIETPLILSGFSQETVDRFGDRFRALGLSPVAGMGGSDDTAVQPEPIVPGSAVSAVLIRGDLSMAGTCTVTYVDANHLLACGHPITQFGHVAMPMTKAMVLATLPSPLNAFKIIDTTETVGAFVQDRNAAILGQFGVAARMIPVTVEIEGPAYGPPASSKKPALKAVHFDVLDNRELTPSVMLVSIYQSLQQTNLAAAEISYRISGELTVADQPPVQLAGIMSPNELNPAAINTALYINDKFGHIYANTAEQPIVTGLHLKLEAIGEVRTAVIEQARMSRSELRAGDTTEVEVVIHPFRAAPQTLRIPVTVPQDTPAGDLRLVVGDAAIADRMTLPSGAGGSHPLSLRDAIGQLNRSHINDRVYFTLLAHDAQSVLEGGTLGSVPLSMANVLDPLKVDQRMQLTGETAVEIGSLDAGYLVTGSQVLTLKVK